jgi:hypothetical protein
MALEPQRSRKRERPPNPQQAGRVRLGEYVPAPDGFDELMPKTLATATVDRLMHHAHLCQTAGDSIRLSQALSGKGVIPLS